MTRRTERVAGELLAELARLLREDVTDPRIGLVTLTRIDVAPDLSHALVFWSALDVDAAPERVDERQAGLESAAQFLRHRAAGRLPLRRMPALRFRYDPSLALGSQTLSVLREVMPDAAAGEGKEGGGADASEATEAEGSEHGAET